jgi:hypothetical protein
MFKNMGLEKINLDIEMDITNLKLSRQGHQSLGLCFDI